MKFTTALLALAGSAIAAPAPADSEIVERAVAAKYCDAASSLCYNEYVSAGQAIYRVAIPSTATAAPFDIAFQIVAPKAIMWAGISWGGAMANAPITMGWPNGNNVTLSSRYATGYRLPDVYNDAKYVVNWASTGVNATHWYLTGVCTGCSKWSAKSITPSASVPLAWGVSTRAVTAPANPASAFSAHTAKGKFTFDFTAAKADNFETATKPAA
jgi:hypothetical protein